MAYHDEDSAQTYQPSVSGRSLQSMSYGQPAGANAPNPHAGRNQNREVPEQTFGVNKNGGGGGGGRFFSSAQTLSGTTAFASQMMGTAYPSQLS